jgi:hypothetical protein
MLVNTVRFPLSSSLLALLAGSVLCACHSSAVLPPGADNPGVAVGNLRSANPLDVAVLKVENTTGREGLPTEELRELMHAGLVDRHYSPLGLEYVDRKTTEASYRPGASNENAILKIVIMGWEDSTWRTHSRLTIDADIWLLDAARPSTAQALWGGHVTRTLDMSREREVLATESALMTRTLKNFTDAVLASLPARNPELATAR